MNEQLQYASMLEIPVNTCSVTLRTVKKKKFGRKKDKSPEVVKEELMNKINSEQIEELAIEQEEKIAEQIYSEEILEDSEEQPVYQENTVKVTTAKPKAKPKFKLSLITTQLIIIGVLIATIFLTNALYADSGINVFFKSVFGTNQTQSVDLRTHEEFAPVLAVGDMSSVNVNEGIITFSGEGSVYSPCDGRVSALSQDENGKYVFEITHSENFKSVISGLDYAYAGVGDSVYSNIPVGYVNSNGATMCFMSGNDAVISNYQIVDGSVVWAV